MAVIPTGFDKNLFINPSFASAFQCIKCGLICIDIREINCNKGHLCCVSCWNNHNMINCPLCNESKNNLIISRFVEGQQSKLKMKSCPNKLCNSWNSTFDKLLFHLKHECLFRMNECSHCHKLFIYKEYMIHRETCDYLKVSCPLLCDKNKRWLRKKISYHLKNECPNYEIKCDYFRNGCKEKLKRYEMKQHLKFNCLYRMVECPFIKYGCDIKQKQMHYYQLTKHLKEYQLKHLSLKMVHVCDQLQNMENIMNEKFNEQSKQIEFLQRKLKYESVKNNSIIDDDTENKQNSLSNDCNGLLVFCGSKNGKDYKQNCVEWINLKNKTKHSLFSKQSVNDINRIYNHQYIHLSRNVRKSIDWTNDDDTKQQQQYEQKEEKHEQNGNNNKNKNNNLWDVCEFSSCIGYNVSFSYIQPYLLNSSFGNNTSLKEYNSMFNFSNKEFWKKEKITMVFRCGGYLSHLNGQKLSRVDGFTLETNDWFQLPYMNDILYGSAAIYSNIYGLIVCGGKNDENITVNTIQQLTKSKQIKDKDNNILKWQYLPKMFKQRYCPSICVWKDMKSINYNESQLLIVSGGWNEQNGHLKACSIYDFNSCEFHQISDMNIARSSHSLIHWKFRNKCIVVGGINKNNFASKSIEQYDLIKDVWTNLPNLNESHGKHPCVWVDNSLLYHSYNGILCVCGDNNNNNNNHNNNNHNNNGLGSIEILDVRDSRNKWQTVTHLSSFFQSDQYKNKVFRRMISC